MQYLGYQTCNLVRRYKHIHNIYPNCNYKGWNSHEVKQISANMKGTEVSHKNMKVWHNSNMNSYACNCRFAIATRIATKEFDLCRVIIVGYHSSCFIILPIIGYWFCACALHCANIIISYSPCVMFAKFSYFAVCAAVTRLPVWQAPNTSLCYLCN